VADRHRTATRHDPGGTNRDKIHKHRTQLPSSLLMVRPDLPPDFVRILERMMAKNPDRRFPTAAAVEVALRMWAPENPDEPMDTPDDPAFAEAVARLQQTSDPSLDMGSSVEAGRSPRVIRHAIVQYLNLIPQRIQQNFARQEDPTGTTVPVTWAMQQPEDLLPRLPRFRAGESPPNAPKWVLTKRLGLGGFGEVWQAKHKLLKDRYAAFKFCLDPASQKRVIEHEMEVIDQVMKQLRHHPNIVALEEVDLNDTAPGRPRLAVVPG
jgi:serine/threonine protein kinase